jgi:hypothetical protein
MMNDESQKKPEIRNPKQGRMNDSSSLTSSQLRASEFFRHLAFGIRHSPLRLILLQIEIQLLGLVSPSAVRRIVEPE